SIDLHQAGHRALLGRRVVREWSSARSEPGLAGALHDGGLHRGMNLLTGVAVAQFLEVLAPPGIDALRVGEELFVESFNVGSVAAREWRRGQQLAKAGGHTGKKSLWTQGPGATKGRYVSRTGGPPEGDWGLILGNVT